MAKLDLTKYGIHGATEIIHNPSYEVLFEAEMDPSLEGFEKGQLTELGAVNVMTGIYTGRSPKDKFIVMDENSKNTVWWTTPEYANDNKPASQEAWNECKRLAVEQLSNKKLYVMDVFCGTNPDSRMAVRFIMENMPFFISPPYQVFRMTCSLEVMLKMAAVSEFRPSSLKFSTLALAALKETKSGSKFSSSSAVGAMNMFLTK